MDYTLDRGEAIGLMMQLRERLNSIEQAARRSHDRDAIEAIRDAWEATERLALALSDCVGDEAVVVPSQIERQFAALGYECGTDGPAERLQRLVAIALPVLGDPTLHRVRPSLLQRDQLGRLEIRIRDGVIVSLRDKDHPANNRGQRR